MNTTNNNIGRSLHLLLLALFGLSVYALVFALFALAAGILLSSTVQAQASANAGVWTPTGSLITARAGHTATLLSNGKVLVAGGSASNAGINLDSAELYDPVSRTWTATGSLVIARAGHRDTLLPNGKVLVAGGNMHSVTNGTDYVTWSDSAEIYDPSSGTWSLTASTVGHHVGGFSATLLQNGKVLIVGGNVPAEIYDPTTGTWSVTGSLVTPRYGHTATLLPDGKVLVAGGVDFTVPSQVLASAEIYDPATGKWSATGNLINPRVDHTAVLLRNGKVLVASGFDGTFVFVAEIFDPVAGNWTEVSNAGFVTNRAFIGNTETLLADGEVLIAGGGDVADYTNAGTRLYDEVTSQWREAASMSDARASHTATLLANGQVLVVGGAGDTSILNSAELYTPPVSIDSTFTGAWYDPAQSGHGILLEVLPGNRIDATWYAFNPAGNQQAWFSGVGTYSGSTATIASVVQPAGGRWIPNFNPTSIVRNPWGMLTFNFTDNNHGTVNFNSVNGYGSGSMKLTRLTQAAAQTMTATQATSVPIGPVGAVATDKSGNVYFSTSPGLVYKLTAQGTLTSIAGTGVAGYSGDGGPAAQAQLNIPLFNYPEFQQDSIDFSELVGGLAIDSTGNVYVADAYNNRVRKIDAKGIITTEATATTLFRWPQGVALDSNDNLYVNTAYGTLQKITPAGLNTTLAGPNCGKGFLGPGICVPEEIAIDAAGNIFVPDAYCRVREVKTDGSIFTVAGDDHDQDLSHGLAFTCGYSGDGGLATNAALSNAPFSVATDASGNLYIADTYNHCIRKVDSAGIIHSIAGVCTSTGFAGDGGPAVNALLNAPHGVAVDTAGNLYIADTGNNRIRKVTTDGIITTIAGNGSAAATAIAANNIGAAFTGSWYDPAQSGHGLILEVLANNNIAATWFAFNPAGDQQAWFAGAGTYSGNTATVSDMIQPTGGRWIPNFNPNAIVRNPWGTLTFTFSDCNHGRVDFNSVFGYGVGSMDLTRLTLPAGLTCP